LRERRDDVLRHVLLKLSPTLGNLGKEIPFWIAPKGLTALMSVRTTILPTAGQVSDLPSFASLVVAD
jgi:hypothetical protein